MLNSGAQLTNMFLKSVNLLGCNFFSLIKAFEEVVVNLMAVSLIIPVLNRHKSDNISKRSIGIFTCRWVVKASAMDLRSLNLLGDDSI